MDDGIPCQTVQCLREHPEVWDNTAPMGPWAGAVLAALVVVPLIVAVVWSRRGR